ncbi:hypothetical protein IF1G_09552 [Cordyceps javanica]|uniref:Uncharacterized protein n=1 Tax=Cordyceps javanica TaxID=43265 RepID=A0A545UR70_9HYPO|nr:hypothetical protein IF1G_09552 [Cordyceps javanica]TQW03913.1 hypothetical protein IF2G_08742 [Cordyceps javanica]
MTPGLAVIATYSPSSCFVMPSSLVRFPLPPAPTYQFASLALPACLGHRADEHAPMYEYIPELALFSLTPCLPITLCVCLCACVRVSLFSSLAAFASGGRGLHMQQTMRQLAIVWGRLQGCFQALYQ